MEYVPRQGVSGLTCFDYHQLTVILQYAIHLLQCGLQVCNRIRQVSKTERYGNIIEVFVRKLHMQTVIFFKNYILQAQPHRPLFRGGHHPGREIDCINFRVRKFTCYLYSEISSWPKVRILFRRLYFSGTESNIFLIQTLPRAMLFNDDLPCHIHMLVRTPNGTHKWEGSFFVWCEFHHYHFTCLYFFYCNIKIRQGKAVSDGLDIADKDFYFFPEGNGNFARIPVAVVRSPCDQLYGVKPAFSKILKTKNPKNSPYGGKKNKRCSG